MILTSNRDIDEWSQVFPDPVIANATIDRIFDNAEICLFKGRSYHLKGKIEVENIDLKFTQNNIMKMSRISGNEVVAVTWDVTIKVKKLKPTREGV